MNDNQLKVLAARVIFFWLLLDLQSVLLRYVVVIVVHLGQVLLLLVLKCAKAVNALGEEQQFAFIDFRRLRCSCCRRPYANSPPPPHALPRRRHQHARDAWRKQVAPGDGTRFLRLIRWGIVHPKCVISVLIPILESKVTVVLRRAHNTTLTD